MSFCAQANPVENCGAIKSTVHMDHKLSLAQINLSTNPIERGQYYFGFLIAICLLSQLIEYGSELQAVRLLIIQAKQN